MASNNVHF